MCSPGVPSQKTNIPYFPMILIEFLRTSWYVCFLKIKSYVLCLLYHKESLCNFFYFGQHLLYRRGVRMKFTIFYINIYIALQWKTQKCPKIGQLWRKYRSEKKSNKTSQKLYIFMTFGHFWLKLIILKVNEPALWERTLLICKQNNTHLPNEIQALPCACMNSPITLPSVLDL